MNILCIDPGTIESGVVGLAGVEILDPGVIKNEELLISLKKDWYPEIELLLIEMVACYGMPVGKETFETCVWIGRFIEAFHGPYEFVYRRDVKTTLCGSMRAKDANVRQAIIDRYPATGGGKTPQIGTKFKPGPLFGVSKHVWSALAVGLAWNINQVELKNISTHQELIKEQGK